MFEKPIVMLDFETTGLSPDMGSRITEVAALRIVGDEIVDRFVSLVNCNVRIPADIIQLTGITQAMVDAAPPANHVVPELIKFIGRDSLAAHNASFDAKFLQAEGARLRLVPDYEHLICSVKLSRRIFPGLPSYNLSALAKSLGIQFRGSAHRAEADAEVSANLLLHIGRHMKNSIGIESINAKLLNDITKVSAAKVPTFLKAQKEKCTA